MWYLESNGNIGLKFEVDDGLAITRAGGCDVTKDKIITQEALSTQLSNYYIKAESDEKFALKTDIPDTSNFLDESSMFSAISSRMMTMFDNSVKVGRTNGLSGIHMSHYHQAAMNYNQEYNFGVQSGWNVGSDESVKIALTCKFKDYNDSLNYANEVFAIYKDQVIILGKKKLIHATSKYNYTEEIFTEYVTKEDLANQSQTITHLAPISEEYSINDFIVGAPVYMTGKVYNRLGDDWILTTVNDSIDCIPSVKTNGTWKEYLGICTSKTDKEIRFATHGDYLVKVNDSSTYGIGDTVYIEDYEYDNKIIPVLKILSEDIILTTKINRMTVGIVTSIIDSKTISVFRE